MNNIRKNSRKTTIIIWSPLDINQLGNNSSYAMNLWFNLFSLILKVYFTGNGKGKRKGTLGSFPLSLLAPEFLYYSSQNENSMLQGSKIKKGSMIDT